MKINASVDGLTEVSKALESLPEDIRRVVSRYVNTWSYETLSGTRARVHRRSGVLARSYGRVTRKDGLQAAVGSGLYRAKFEELGTRRQRAHPALYPSFRAANRTFRELVKDTEVDLGKVRTRVRRLVKPNTVRRVG